MFSSDDVASLVVTFGNSTCAVGFGGDESPKCVFPSRVGRSKIETSASSTSKSSRKSPKTSTQTSFVGVQEITLPKDHMEIIHPLEKGKIVDWDACESMWEHAFSKRLRIDPSEHPILHSESPSVPSQQREKMTEIMFEKFNSPAYFVVKDAVLACFANARQSSLVVDVGGGGTQITPVFDGYALLQSSIFSELGGDRLTEEVLKIMTSKAEIRPQYKISKKDQKESKSKSKVDPFLNVTSSYHQEMLMRLADDAKIAAFSISESISNNESNQDSSTVSYELPDGKTIEFGPERSQVPELLFNPSSLPGNLFGLHTLAQSSVSKCDVDIRRDLFSSVIFTGATSQMKGLPKRFERELAELLPGQMFKLKMVPSNFSVERKFAPWIGGSILASLGTFQQMWISKSEYDESGATIVNKKCP